MSSTISNVSEYDCWLQPRGAHALPQVLVEQLSHISCVGQGLIMDNALAQLADGLERMFGLSTTIGDRSGGPRTLVGTVAALNESCGLNLPAGKPESFLIEARGELLLVAGQDERGALYGVFRLLMLLARGEVSSGFSLSDAPQTALRMINHWDNLDGSIERGYAGNSIFFADNGIDYDPARIADYARLLASVGINCLSINNVNVRGAAKELITERFLPQVAALAGIFRPYGIRLMLSINFAAPYSFGELDTADPLEESVAEWWARRADLVYKYIPDLAGFLVKADSEFEPGPFQYGRTHADGANMLARAVAPHGGEIIWRCFVYNCTQDWRDHSQDRARAAYDHFMPLDGLMDDNVILQIKHGPYDFQVREPVTPLFGALRKSRHLLELQVTQEYTGHQIDLCFLPWMWQDVMSFDTKHGPNSTMKELLGGRIEGVVAVGNVGLDNNWTGHTLAQANLYGFGRLTWNPAVSAQDIAREWSRLTFGPGHAAAEVAEMLLLSYPAYENYNAPFGVCFMVTPHLHYGPNIEGYEFSKWGTYHRADREAIGIDRTPSGTGYTEQYAPENAAMYRDKATCPENLLLFFHRVRYDYVMKNGKTLLQNIYDTHFQGVEQVERLLEIWKGLQGELGEQVYASVLSRLERQMENAREWRDQINTYFWRRTGIPDGQGRTIYE